MAIKTEEQYTGEFILTEQPGELSRDNVTVTAPATTKLEPGFVLGKITATGAYAPYDNDNTDGTEAAAGVLYGEVDNTAGVAAADFAAVILNFGAEVRKSDLQWGSGVLAAEKTAAYADLAALFIKARD